MEPVKGRRPHTEEYNTPDKRKVKRSISRFKQDHGIYFLFAHEIIDIVAKDYKMPHKEVRTGLFAYYVSKYVSRSRAIHPVLVAAIANEVGIDYTPFEIRKSLESMLKHDLVGKYADVYMINRDTQDWLKQFTNQLTYKLHNINSISYYKKAVEKKRVMVTKRRAKNVRRHNKIAKMLDEVKEDGSQIDNL
jgi:hypothetical protein